MNRSRNTRPAVRQSIRVKITRTVPPHAWDSERLSEDFFRLLQRSLTAGLLIAVVLALMLHWRISHERAAFSRLTDTASGLRKEHAELLLQRNELMSKNRIAAAAAVRLGLQLPEKEQVHRLY